ncbi:MAG: cytochrome c3 family protein [Nitrospiraceae bacterium]|nr:cytochrome c3 family protein [Nitrospiraceae bacterium]
MKTVVSCRNFASFFTPHLSALLLAGVLSALFWGVPAASADVDCLQCHKALTEAKVVHPALQMGCTSCHTGIDASKVPHRKTNKIAKGLSADQPELCFGCHDKKMFTKKTVHPAISMGCTGCHNPHSSKYAKLLVAEPPGLCYTCHDKTVFSGKKDVHAPVAGGMCTSCHGPHSTDTQKLLLSELPDLCYTCHDKQKFVDKYIHAPVGIGMCTSCHSPHQSANDKLLVKTPPDLCFTCHDKAAFSKKNVHAPVAGGMCLDCHLPHAAPEIALLKKEPTQVCLGCHPNVRKGPHAVSGFSAVGHPIGLPVRHKKPPDDPARPGKKFYCGSCHNPHSSDSIYLFRYPARSTMGLCQYCHKM